MGRGHLVLQGSLNKGSGGLGVELVGVGEGGEGAVAGGGLTGFGARD